MPDDKYAIQVKSVSKDFVLPHQRVSTLKTSFVSLLRFKKRYDIERQHAVSGVSFNVEKGDFFGIVGRNGSGKSTLLKCIAGVYTPNQGSIDVAGSLVPFIELGVGFNDELSGRDNVYLNSALLGFSRSQVDGMYDEIVEFAELDAFMDQKLKNYSSGMKVRLAFSIAIRARSDILLLDEVLAVGDAGFQKKCYEFFREIQNAGRTIIFVSHDLGAVERFCNKAVLLDGGKIVAKGDPKKILEKYQDANVEREEQKEQKEAEQKSNKEEKGGEIHFKNGAKISIKTINQKGEVTKIFGKQEKLTIEVSVTASMPIDESVIGLTLEPFDGKTVFAATTEDVNKTIKLNKGATQKISFEVQNVFPDGVYLVDCALMSVDRATTFARIDNRKLKIVSNDPRHWLLRPDTHITLSD